MIDAIDVDLAIQVRRLVVLLVAVVDLPKCAFICWIELLTASSTATIAARAATVRTTPAATAAIISIAHY
jgi:hypothetical protein